MLRAITPLVVLSQYAFIRNPENGFTDEERTELKQVFEERLVSLSKIKGAPIYGMINLTGETEMGPFWKQILEGRKTQTIREPRADGKPHVSVGSIVKLYWKVRRDKPMKHKPIHLIGHAMVLSYERIKLGDVWDDESNAHADGFHTLTEFREWFDKPLDKEYYVIRFAMIKKAIPKCPTCGADATLILYEIEKDGSKTTLFIPYMKCLRESTSFNPDAAKWRLDKN